MSMEIKALSVDCWIPWKLGPLKARQDPRPKKKHLRDGGFEPVHIFRSLGWKLKPSASSRKRWDPYCRRAGLANMDKECGRQGPPRKFLPRRNRILPQSAFWRAWLHRTRFPASFLWRGMACRAWAGHMRKILPWRSRILALVGLEETWLHRTRFLASFLWCGVACRAWAGHRQKILPWRSRILGLVAFQETWLHRTRFPVSFLWWGMACRAWAGHRQKILPWRSRILGVWFQETWLHRTRFPACFLRWRMACRVWAGHRQKILPRRNRILGKWLFRRLAVGNTIKTLGFRNVLWESGPWKKFLNVLCPARNLRESGSFGKVSYYKVWPYI